MTLCEVKSNSPRQPAIPPETLRLRTGEFANKYSLLEVGLKAGLPIPPIMTPDDLLALSEQGKRVEKANLDEYLRKVDQYTVYRRGYFSDPVDMWAVDILPTTQLYDPSDEKYFAELLTDSITDPTIATYLQTNFGLPKVPPAESFLQKALPHELYYLSTLSIAHNLFAVARTSRSNRFMLWMHFQDERWVIGHTAATNMSLFSTETVLPLVRNADEVFNHTLAGNFAYKYDFLCSGSDAYLIQARVASKKVSPDGLRMWQSQIAEALNNGAAHIQMEVGKMKQFAKAVPDKPYVLYLTNFEHHGEIGTVVKTLDFSNMVGLRLPEGLAGGLLEHDAYHIIAYALYWGVPIEFVK